MITSKNKKIVADILARNEKSRNDDVYGTLLVWLNKTDKCFNGPKGKAIHLEDIQNMKIQQDDFKRIRAWFNSEKGGKIYLPTDPKVIEKRQKRQRKVKQELGYENPRT